MADCEITCIKKQTFGTTHEYITHVGNLQSANWLWTKEDVIKSIDGRTNTFYVFDKSRIIKAYVAVVRPAIGSPYLRTHADGVWTDNLLSLPEC
jgi:hypothetical protein